MALGLQRSHERSTGKKTLLLGFDCPAANSLRAAHGVYHADKDGRQGVAKLQAATAKLQGEARQRVERTDADD